MVAGIVEDAEELTVRAQKCSATAGTEGWRLLVEHFEGLSESERTQVYATGTADEKRRELVLIEAGRRQVLEWFREQIEEAREARHG